MILVHKTTGLVYECIPLFTKYMLISKGYDLGGNYYNVIKTIPNNEFEELGNEFVYVGEL